MATTTDWATLPAGRDVDEAVAEHVMGWVRGNTRHGHMPWRAPGEHVNGGRLGVPPYSTDIAAAWLVLDAIRAGTPEMRVEFSRAIHGQVLWQVSAPDAALLICRAALAALAALTTRGV